MPLQENVDKITGETFLLAPDPVSFQWIGPAALLVNLVVGIGLSWILSRTKLSSDLGESASHR